MVFKEFRSMGLTWSYQEPKIPSRSPQVSQKLTREYFTTHPGVFYHQSPWDVKASRALLGLYWAYLGLFKSEISKEIYLILSWYLQYSI